MAFSVVLIATFYLVFIAVVIYGNTLLKEQPTNKKKQPECKIDVFVPIKNEEEKLPLFLECLTKQSYPSSNFHVYFINDGSTDNSVNLLSGYCQTQQNSTFLNSRGNGKKQALLSAFKCSTNSIILLTDADTAPQTHWIESHALSHTSEMADMVIGRVKMIGKAGLLNKLQAAEYYSISAITSGMAAINKPVMCSAANLSFKREAINSFSNALNLNFKSGDDMFLMHDFKKRHKKIIPSKYKNGSVLISPEPFSKFIGQRLRWSGKYKGYTDKLTLITGGLVFIMNLTILVLAGMTIAGVVEPKLFLGFFLAKFIADITLILSFVKTERPIQLFYATLLSFAYPFYSVYMAIAGMLLTGRQQTNNLNKNQ